MPSAGARRLAPVLGLWLTFSGASLGIVNKYGGLAGFALYAGALAVGRRLGDERWAAALALGVALSSRANFLLLASLVYSQLGQRAGWRIATGLGAAVAASFAAVTLPFYLHDPAGFTPLHTSNKIEQYSGVLAHASLWVGGGSGLLAAFFRNCAWVQACPIACAVLLGSRVNGLAALREDLVFYGDFFLYFAALGAWLALHERIAGAGSAPAQMASARAHPPGA